VIGRSVISNYYEIPSAGTLKITHAVCSDSSDQRRTSAVLTAEVAGYLVSRKPVLIDGALVMLVAGLAAIYVPLGMLGMASGAAIIPFPMMKEANPSQIKGTAADDEFPGIRDERCPAPFISRLMLCSQNTPLTLHEIQAAFLLLVGSVMASRDATIFYG
jgi:hypothetical protein